MLSIILIIVLLTNFSTKSCNINNYFETSHLAIFTKQPQNLLQTLHFCMSLSKDGRTIVSVNFKLNEKHFLLKLVTHTNFNSHDHSLELVFIRLIALHRKPIMSNAQAKDSVKNCIKCIAMTHAELHVLSVTVQCSAWLRQLRAQADQTHHRNWANY